MRIMVSERMKKGDKEGKVIDLVVDRYGELVIIKKSLKEKKEMIWGFNVIIIMIGGGEIIVDLRSRRDDGKEKKKI